MIKKLSTIVLAGFCTFLLASAFLSAEDKNEKEHTLVGTRTESIEKRMAHLETRDKMAALNPEEGNGAATAAIGSKSMMMPRTIAKGLYYTSHPAAYQNLVSISFFGDVLELMDGSRWQISQFDAYISSHWYPLDVVVITPNHSWLSSYAYRLTNQNTGESVAANMNLGPFAPAFGSPYTHWIVAIDYYHNTVYLEDGSVWYMSSFDGSIVNQWIIGDVMIVGVNDGWLSKSNPNILINVAMLNFAAGAAAF